MLKSVILLDTSKEAWFPVPRIPGAYYKPVNEDPDTGRCIWQIRQDAGCIFPEHNHPAWTQMLVTAGEMTGPEGTFQSGGYQCIPPGFKHGPYQIGLNGMEGILISDGPIW